MRDDEVMAGARVAALRVHPLKSAQGPRVGRARLGTAGADHDRAWALFDPRRPRPLSAKRVPQLLELEASVSDGGGLVVDVPGAGPVDEPEVASAVSAWLGDEVELRRAADGEPRFFDDAPVHLLTTASLAAMAERHPGDWDPRRFRPTVLVDAGDGAAGLVEDGWVGRELRVGAARLRVIERTVRCTMVAEPQPGGLPHDPAVQPVLHDANGDCLGVYAEVVGEGWVAEGDPVQLVG